MGLERLLDKQEVCGSNPHVPTKKSGGCTDAAAFFALLVLNWYTAPAAEPAKKRMKMGCGFADVIYLSYICTRNKR